MKKWSGFLGKPHMGHSDFWTLPLINRGPCTTLIIQTLALHCTRLNCTVLCCIAQSYYYKTDKLLHYFLFIFKKLYKILPMSNVFFYISVHR